ncbi:hypothetical protein CHS0354_007322 [Potamilus streckersoni]|uniref:Uncharacterized protein n=1 Tax=Potamilus streckersoni TaxID=2493646 RepID=A0AAE0TDA4_9BIVA|nr:hypothetical protein CHS0354_007322 [Potamilus streckersoni]
MNDIDEFRFPCFVDICTFPQQYCNSDADERRCNYCTVPICKSSFIPDPCKYYCKNLGSSTTTTIPSLAAAMTSPQNHSEVISYYPTYVGILLMVMAMTIAVLSLSIALLIVYLCRKSKLSTDARVEQGENQEKMPLMKRNVEDDSVSSSTIPDSSLSSSHSTNPISQPVDSCENESASQGPPPYPNETRKKPIETLQGYQMYTEYDKRKPNQLQTRRTPSPESDGDSHATLPMSGDLRITSLFTSSPEVHHPKRNNCCSELVSKNSEK